MIASADGKNRPLAVATLHSRLSYEPKDCVDAEARTSSIAVGAIAVRAITLAFVVCF